MIMDPCFTTSGVKASCSDKKSSGTKDSNNRVQRIIDTIMQNDPCCPTPKVKVRSRNSNTSCTKNPNKVTKCNIEKTTTKSSTSKTTDSCFPAPEVKASFCSSDNNNMNNPLVFYFKNYESRPLLTGNELKRSLCELMKNQFTPMDPCYDTSTFKIKCLRKPSADDLLVSYYKKYKPQLMVAGFLLVLIFFAHKLLKCRCCRRRVTSF